MIFQILEANFPLLMELFKFYCAMSGMVGSVHEMEFVEFATMVKKKHGFQRYDCFLTGAGDGPERRFGP
jgi:hypothetical protein